MNKRTAKKALQDQKNKLEVSDQWIIQTGSIIVAIFGISSNEYFYMSKINFSFPYTGQSSEDHDQQLRVRLNQIRKFLDNCIETVDVKGVYTPISTNFLSGLKTFELLSYLLGAALVVFSSGFYLGGYFTKIDNQDLKIENKTLRDSLLLTKSFGKNSDQTTNKQSKGKNSNNK